MQRFIKYRKWTIRSNFWSTKHDLDLISNFSNRTHRNINFHKKEKSLVITKRSIYDTLTRGSAALLETRPITNAPSHLQHVPITAVNSDWLTEFVSRRVSANLTIFDVSHGTGGRVLSGFSGRFVIYRRLHRKEEVRAAGSIARGKRARITVNHGARDERAGETRALFLATSAKVAVPWVLRRKWSDKERAEATR